MTLSFESRSPAETRRLGRALAAHLQPGDVLLLQGELGAGKTCFSQGIGARLHVYHADLFRLEDPREVFELGLEENAADGLLLVEWPDRAPREMPPDHLLVRFDVTDHTARRVTYEPHGARYESLLRDLQKETPRARR
jgi:tRNA threonylcarbamoyladenosine biosynthesis protein TsaE